MSSKSNTNRYNNPQALERLMLLISTLLKYPGVGCRPEEITLQKGNHHDALKLVQSRMRELAAYMGLDWAEGYPATPTIRKDFEYLKSHQILDRRMYRWGYYLGTGVMNKQELKLAFNALESQAIYQGDPRLRQVHQALKLRLRGFEFEENKDFFYPVRQHLNRAINYTDPEEMMRKGEYRHTLFHQIELLEQVIITGQAVEISRSVDLYNQSRVGLISVWALQLIYHDIAWYLLYEDCHNNCLAMGRVNRFKDYLEVLTQNGRGIEAQKRSLQTAYKLLDNGWGLYLGDSTEQQLELQGKLDFIAIKVRFFPPVSAFIEEGELRHPKQKIKQGKKDLITGKPEYVDYLIKLPPRSLNEFGFWLHRYMDKAVVISPPELVEKHRQSAMALANRYQES